MIPAIPEDAGRSEGRMELRYEDITQDGHLRTVAMSHAMGKAFWAAKAPELFKDLRTTGVVPILSRMCCEAGQGPLGLRAGLQAEAPYHFAHVARDDGSVQRIVMRVWTTLRAERGVIHGPLPEGAGEIIEVGRVHAEHVFTRLFAAPGERRVIALEGSGLPRVPERRISRVAPSDVLTLPEGAAWTTGWQLDPAPVVFGLDHTDANQHVNSIVYPQLFRDAALRGWARSGAATAVRICSDELLFRKPCFAGQRLKIGVRCFMRDNQAGAVLALLPFDVADGDLDRLAGVSCHTVSRVGASDVSH
jgi:hypothetical protein